MFGFFNKKSWKIEGKEFAFFRQVFSKLPADLSFLSAGLDKGLYTRFSINQAIKGNFYSIGFDPTESDKSMTKGKHFELENIIISQGGQSFPLNISIYDGLWIGFEIDKNILDFNNFQVDLSSFRKKKSKFSPDTQVEELVIGLTCQQLDLTNLAEIHIDGNTYHEIKDLEDGNFITIDNKGQVFLLTHDPPRIEILNKSLQRFVDDVNHGNFDFNKYLNGQNGEV